MGVVEVNRSTGGRLKGEHGTVSYELPSLDARMVC